MGPSYERTHLTFPQLDTDVLKVKMNLKEEAGERGKKNLPPTAAARFDDVEQKIVTFINNQVKSATESYYDDLRSFEDRMNRLNAAGNAGQIEAISIAAEADFKAHVHKRKDELYTARAVVTECESDLKNFKKLNELDRSARYPDSRILYFSIVTALVTIETYINGMFFAQGHEQGIIGGIFTALIPSLLNATAGYYLGNFAFRLAVHRRWPQRASGIFLCLLLPALVFAMNLAVAHYRSAMINLTEYGSIQAAKDALTTFLSTPFILSDVESWFLFALGSIFCLIATIDFWKMDDPYPHFGEITRDHKAKINDYADKKSEILEELQDVRDDRLEELNEACELVSAKANEANAVFDSKKRWTTLYQDHLTHLESAGRELLAYYHTINMGERTEKPPKYFQQEWNLDRPELPVPGIDFLKALNNFQSEVTGVQSLYSGCSKRIGKSYMAALEEYQTIEQLQPEELKKWLTDKETEIGEEELAAAA